MQELLGHLKQRATEDWLIGHDSRKLSELSEQLFLELTKLQLSSQPLKILLAEEDPVRFLACFVAACAAGSQVFLCNPRWVPREWQQVVEIVEPDLIWGQLPSLPFPLMPSPRFPISRCSPQQSARIMIPTGGSSGRIRFTIHSWATLTASVQGFHQYFGQKPINSFCVLPLYHVSGLMQFLRSLTTGGRMVIEPFKALIAVKECDLDPREFFISLVPTQLTRLMELDFSPWLSCFRTVLLGGAPAWGSLLEEARRHSIPLAPTYGMTETASGVVTLQSEDFLKGNHSSGQVLPHAHVKICNVAGNVLAANQTGMITIKADSLALGYYPESFNQQQYLATDDLGFFDEQGYLHIIGRRSNKIITGGENVFPAEVEATIRATGLVSDVCVIGLPDQYWGQVVSAIYVPRSLKVSTATLEKEVATKLSKFKLPKYWLALENLPRNSQGKVNYQELKRVAEVSLKRCLPQ
ncbi:AMP-binding protein [Lyngbya aestuarii]|uniref:AMP-binding protein n=1 Tax=Lyngbya aestuarii TaxID=118322 RepID=UPI00403E35D7